MALSNRIGYERKVACFDVRCSRPPIRAEEYNKVDGNVEIDNFTKLRKGALILHIYPRICIFSLRRRGRSETTTAKEQPCNEFHPLGLATGNGADHLT